MKTYVVPHAEDLRTNAVSVIATSAEPREAVRLDEKIGNIVVPTATVGASEIFK